ncbi:MAG: ATP-binding protein [Candidatus Omnitrophica bacterium]|nr:ATP-binding protein [Candidatus Omnitrophota bacterium]
MYSRLIKPPEAKSFFLFGPRGTGKTTWVKSTFKQAVYIDLLEAELFNDLLANPQRLENFIPKNFSDWVIIDEVQKIPQLLDEVHRLIEKYKYKFILTGSSARKLRREGPNLLGGRALTYWLHPFTVMELGEDFNLGHSLKFGQLPCTYTEADPKAYLESYVKTYLEEEVHQEGLTRNLAAFTRFLEAASFSQGSLLNISSVARECAVERKVVEDYFSILEDLLIAYRVPVFTKRAKRRLVTHPKFYYFDVGVYRTLRPMGPLDMPEEAEGAAFETLLFQELKAINDALDLGYTISYWRTSNDMEVDFVLYGNQGIRAFEVKRTGKVSKSMLSGLISFLKDYPMAKAYFIYGGERRLRHNDIEIVPMSNALKELPILLS